MTYSLFFFFSSRRRHTRWTGDWSSDVCSSDLRGRGEGGALALGDHARRLRLGLGARIGDAPQLDFRRLALARHVQPALLLAQLCLRRLAGAALGLDAVALRCGALAVRFLQLVEQLAHLLALALALAGEKSRLIMSPRASE